MASPLLDFKKFKYVDSDDKTTTLQHEGGHQLTLHHSSLSKDNQAQLKAMAQGGKVKKDPTAGMTKPSEVPPAQQEGARKAIEAANPPAHKSSVAYADGGKVKDQGIFDTIKKTVTDSFAEEPPPRYKGAPAPINKQRATDMSRAFKAEGGEIDKTLAGEGDTPENPNMSSQQPQAPVNININSGTPPPAPVDKVGAAEEAYKQKAGGGYYQDPAQQPPQDTGVQTADSQAPTASAPNMSTPPQNAGGVDGGMSTPQAHAPQQQAAEAPAPTGQPPMPVAPVPQAPPPPAPNTPEAHAMNVKNELSAEDEAWQHDMANGHITPETMSSMFGKKDTLGKIGTIFGLMISGLGSGLTGQPNALISLMQKQIDNDLEAQKQSKANAQNFLRINQQGQMNEATIKKMVQEGKLTEAQARNYEQDTLIKTTALTRANLTRSFMAKLVQDTVKLPEGSEARQKADATLAMLYPKMDASIMDGFTQAGAASAVANFAGNTGSGSDEQNFQANNRALKLSGDPAMAHLAEDKEVKHLPGVSGLASRPIPEDARKQILAMDVLDKKGKDVLEFAQKHKGSLDPKTKAVALQKIEEMKNFYNDSIKGGALTQGRLSWYDEQFAKDPTSILSQFMGSSAKLKEMVESNKARKDAQIQNFFPDYKGESKSKSFDGMKPKDGAEAKSKSGKPMIFKDGKWSYK